MKEKITVEFVGGPQCGNTTLVSELPDIIAIPHNCSVAADGGLPVLVRLKLGYERTPIVRAGGAIVYQYAPNYQPIAIEGD